MGPEEVSLGARERRVRLPRGVQEQICHHPLFAVSDGERIEQFAVPTAAGSDNSAAIQRIAPTDNPPAQGRGERSRGGAARRAHGRHANDLAAALTGELGGAIRGRPLDPVHLELARVAERLKPGGDGRLGQPTVLLDLLGAKARP